MKQEQYHITLSVHSSVAEEQEETLRGKLKEKGLSEIVGICTIPFRGFENYPELNASTMRISRYPKDSSKREPMENPGRFSPNRISDCASRVSEYILKDYNKRKK